MLLNDNQIILLNKVLDYIIENEEISYDEFIEQYPERNPAEHIYHVAANLKNALK